MNEREFQDGLRDAFAVRASYPDVEVVSERILATPLASTPLKRSRLAPLTGRFAPMLNATRYVVAAAVVALFGGFLLVGVLTTQPEETRPPVGATATPESTTTRPIELPAEIPEGIESGSLRTQLGPARWVHLTGDETTIPPALSGLISTPDGYVVPEWVDGGDAQLWRSSDLIGWSPEPLGIEARFGELSRPRIRVGDIHALVTP